MDSPASAPATQMGTVDRTTLTIIAINLSWVTGIIGSFMDEGSDGQIILWSIANLAGLAGAGLLCIRHVRLGNDMAAAGFLGLAALTAAGSVIGFSGTPTNSVFVSMAILHLTALMLIAVQGWSATWARGAAALSGILFAVWGYAYTLGDQAEPPDIDDPILTAAWAFFTLAIIGWTLTLREEG